MSMNDKEARDLGMDRPIARRDIISGIAVAVAGSAASKIMPAAAATAPAGNSQVGAPAGAFPDYYPPKLTGLRGSYVGSFEQAHKARDGGFSPGTAAEDTKESYDLIVVGGGISGLSAAHFYRQMLGENKRVLIIDNHDDFGGHAKRNEFHYQGRMILGYGGTQSIHTPYPYSITARSLIKELGIDVMSYKAHQRNDVYKDLGRGTFFDKEHFGADKLVIQKSGASDWPAFFAEAPLTKEAREDLIRLYTAKTDYMPDLDPMAKAQALKKMSYLTFLKDYAKIHPTALPYFNNQGFRNNKRVDTCPAYEAAGGRAPGFAGMKIDQDRAWEGENDYQFHFPDGNATVARLLVNRMVPNAWTRQHDMNTVATGMIDYTKLDLPDNPVRIRLSSTGILAEHDGNPASAKWVNVTYARDNKLYRARAANVVMACYNNIIKYIVPALPQVQKDALSYASKVPMQYTNVLIRNWQAFKKLGIQSVNAPNGYHSGVGLDIPVAMDGYNFASTPDDPIVVHLTRNPNAPGIGLSRKDQNRAGRADMLETPFAKIEKEIRSQMARSLHGGGFDPAKDIVAITVNRWPHGYAYTYDTLGDPEFAENERPHVIGRRVFGRIAIANSDAGAGAFTNEAIDQAQRAIFDCLYSRGLV